MKHSSLIFVFSLTLFITAQTLHATHSESSEPTKSFALFNFLKNRKSTSSDTTTQGSPTPSRSRSCRFTPEITIITDKKTYEPYDLTIIGPLTFQKEALLAQKYTIIRRFESVILIHLSYKKNSLNLKKLSPNWKRNKIKVFNIIVLNIQRII